MFEEYWKVTLRHGAKMNSARPRGVDSLCHLFTRQDIATERHRSPAAAAGERLNHEKPKCRRGQVQRLVRRCLLIALKITYSISVQQLVSLLCLRPRARELPAAEDNLFDGRPHLPGAGIRADLPHARA
jgi:hypothetical protein